MQKIEIPFQDLGINTEVDDDQNPGYTRQERTNFINGKVEKIKGLANQQLSGINMDPDIVKFWKFEDKEYFLVVDNYTGQIYKFNKDLSSPELLYTATGGALRVDIEGNKAIIYNLGQSPLVSVVIDRNMYHGIVGGGNYPKFNGSFLDWNRVRVFDDVASPSAGKKLFKIDQINKDNLINAENEVKKFTAICEFSRPLLHYFGNFKRPTSASVTEVRNLIVYESYTSGYLEGGPYYYRYSLIFDGEQETELSESVIDSANLGIDGENGKGIFEGNFTIDIGNSFVDGSFYPGNPRVTGVNIYRSTDTNGSLPNSFKKIITASTLGAKADLNTISTTTGTSKNFFYDQCDFTQLGVTSSDYVYQGGVGDISEVEPLNTLNDKQEGLLKLSSSTLGGGKGAHPKMVDYTVEKYEGFTGSPTDLPIDKNIDAEYVIVNRDLRTANTGGNGVYWCAEQNGLNDPTGAATFRKGTASDAPTLVDHTQDADGFTTYTGSAGSLSYGGDTVENTAQNVGFFGRNVHSHIRIEPEPSSNFGFVTASFNGTSPGALDVGEEYYWEAWISTPPTDDVSIILAAYTGGSLPVQSGFAWHGNSQLLQQVSSVQNSGVGERRIKVSGYYTPTNANFYLMMFPTDITYTEHVASPAWVDKTNSGSFWNNSYWNNSDWNVHARCNLYEFLITKSANIKRSGTSGCSLGYYSNEFNVIGDDSLQNNIFTSATSSRGYSTTNDSFGWVAGNYGKCVLPWKKNTGLSDDNLCNKPSVNNNVGTTTWKMYSGGYNAYNTLHQFNSNIPDCEGDGILNITPNYSYKYNVEESGGLDNITNNIKIDFNFTDNGIADGADHPGTLTLSTDVRYKYQANHIGRRFVGNIIINGDTDDSETHEDFIMYSELGNSDVIPIANFIKLNDLDGGQITGLAKSLGDLVALMERGVFILSIPSTDITQWTLTEAYRDIGCTAPDSVLEYNNGVFFANETNFYYLDSGRRLISLANSWLNTYQQYFREGGISQVITNPNKNELILIINNFTYVMSLNGFEETARWYKSIQSAVADGDWGEAGIEDFGDQVNVKYVVDNFKQLYKFEERLLDFKRDLVLHSLDDTASDAYTNNTEYGLVIETPFQKLTDLDSNSIVRKFNLRYNSIDDITLEFYVDGDASTIAKTITIPASSTLANYDDNVDFTYEANIKLRANRIKIKISTPESSNTLTSIRRLELEVD